jgi:hypothetical protein
MKKKENTNFETKSIDDDIINNIKSLYEENTEKSLQKRDELIINVLDSLLKKNVNFNYQRLYYISLGI